MAQSARNRTSRRASHAQSITSDSPFTPQATPPPTRRAGAGTRGVRQDTIDSEAQLEITVQATRIPAHYSLPPTVPSPFAGDLEASLDAVLEWGSHNPGSQSVVNALLRSVETSTDWPDLLRTMYLNGEGDGRSRALLESLLFLVTRTLLPEQIAENRKLMAALYDKKKQLAIRLVLRYDMLREWKMDHTWHPMAAATLPPTGAQPPEPIPSATHRALMPNIVSTLIAAPVGGYTTHAVRERMKHHITALDTYLIMTDGEVAQWGDETLLSMASQVMLQWQWLRQNNEVLEEMEMNVYEELEGRADECEWIADDVKKGEWAKVSRKSVAALEAAE